MKYIPSLDQNFSPMILAIREYQALVAKAKQKQEQFPGSVVLLDTDHVLSKAWGLRETNETGVFIIIGRDRKVKFISTVRKPEESKALIKEALKVLEEEINKF